VEAAGASETSVNLNGTTGLKVTEYGKNFILTVAYISVEGKKTEILVLKTKILHRNRHSGVALRAIRFYVHCL